MNKNETSRPGPADDEPSLCRQVRASLRCMGWLPPLNEQDVADAERELAGRRVPLPPGLQDPQAVLRRASRAAGPVPLLILPQSGPIDATLARAAREGGRLTPDVEEAMRRDRKAAEEEMDKGRHGEDVR
jgi:hypothetical protein